MTKKTFYAVAPVLAIALHFGMSNLLYFAVESLFLNVLRIPPQQFMKQLYLGELLVYTVLIIVFFIVYRLLWRKDGNRIHAGLAFRDLIFSIISGAGVSGVCVLWIMLAKQIPVFQKSVAAMEAGAQNIGGGGIVGGFLIAVVAAPMIEEILFRGIVFKSIRKIAPVWLAILISSLLFGAYHMNPVQIVYATFMGVVAGIIYEKTNNLLLPVLVHFTNNFMAMLQQFAPPATEGMIYVIVIIMIIPLGYILYRFCGRGGLREGVVKN